MGRGSLHEASQFAKGCVGLPKRAVVIADKAADEQFGLELSRGIIDAGFAPEGLTFPEGEECATTGHAALIHQKLGELGITNEDLVVALGDYGLCSAVEFCAQTWQGGTSCMLVPTSFNAAVCAGTVMKGLAAGERQDVVRIQPDPSLVLVDLNLTDTASDDDVLLGLVEVVVSALSGSKTRWEGVLGHIPDVNEGDDGALIEMLCKTQGSRKEVLRSANPGAKRALTLGLYSARALERLLPADTPKSQLRAEGVRFETRLAVDVAGLPVDDVFAIDDALEDLGIEELGFELSVDVFLRELRAVKGESSNRFMFALPKAIGTVRLFNVEDDVLKRHAKAYLASRAQLLDEDAE